MQNELLVLALGQDPSFDTGRGSELTPLERSIDDVISNLPEAERGRVYSAKKLCTRYGSILTWTKKQRITQSPKQLQVLAGCCEEILLSQISAASMLCGLQDIYECLWQLDSVIDLVEQYLISKPDLKTLLFYLQQDESTAADLMLQKWLRLQQQMWVSWVVYNLLPSDPTDFWIAREKSDSMSANNIWDAFVVIHSNLPSFVPASLAERVLFLGKVVAILSMSHLIDEEKENWLVNSVWEVFLKNSAPLAGHPAEGRNGKATGPTKRRLGWSSLDAAVKVEHITANVLKTLQGLLMKEHQLLRELKLMRDYFLLQNGYFYQHFIEQTATLMSYPPVRMAEQDINVKFQGLLADVLVDAGDSALKRARKLKLVLPPESKAVDKSSSVDDTSLSIDPRTHTAWDGLEMDYQVSGPLTLILNSSSIQKYNNLFKMLFGVRRAQLALYRVWHLFRVLGRPSRHQSHRQDIGIPGWILRFKMSQFIDNLANYLFSDVITQQCKVLEEKLTKTATFEELVRAHNEFMSDVGVQCFLGVKPLRKCIQNLCGTCLTFCKLVEDNKLELETLDLTEIEKEYRAKSTLAFTILASLKAQALHLSKLLIHIDFNNSFSGQEFAQ